MAKKIKYVQLYDWNVLEMVENGNSVGCVDMEEFDVFNIESLTVKKAFDVLNDQTGRFYFFMRTEVETEATEYA